MPVSLEIPFTVAEGGAAPASAAVEELAADVESAVEGVGELVGWDLAGSDGCLLVAGAESDETRLIAIVTGCLVAARDVRADAADVVVFHGEAELSRRRIRL